MGRLLPTPRTSDQNGTGQHGAGGMDLRTAVKMLPTPSATPYGSNQGGSMGRTGPVRPSLEGVAKLLPTPRASDGPSETSHARTWSSTDFNLHTWAKERAEASLSSGATTSPPSDAGKPSTGLRLNPSFVGWMMGTPSCGECGREWTDPDCPHSATALTCTSVGSSGRR